jgi:GxxExxY protein
MQRYFGDSQQEARFLKERSHIINAKIRRINCLKSHGNLFVPAELAFMEVIWENELATKVIGISMDIHRNTGPGLFERVYEELLAKEFTDNGIRFKRQAEIPLIYKGTMLDNVFRADFIVENLLLLELKSVDQLSKVHYTQVYTYLKLSDLRLGLLINFNVPYLREGIKRIANGIENQPYLKGN